MPTLDDAAREFLSSARIAVAGVSRDRNQAANGIYRTLKAKGYSVVATNPKTDRVEGDACYPDLKSVPGGVEAVLIATPPDAAPTLIQECRELGIRRVWMHRSIGRGSVSHEAVRMCRESGIRVIAGACPLMYCESADVAHRCMRAILGWFGRLPKVD
jgi:predicted CoA-binding protein